MPNKGKVLVQMVYLWCAEKCLFNDTQQSLESVPADDEEV